MTLMLLILGLLLFVGLVVVHEFGHFVVARRNGVEVEEFGIGFPPRIFAKRMRGGYLFTINALPLGGFVRLKGEHDADRKKGSFGAASLSAKVKIILAGVVMNLLAAFLLLTLAAFIGMPKLVENQFTVASDTKVVRSSVLIGYIEPDSPAAKAGLQSKDELASIGTVEGHKQAIADQNEFPGLTEQFAGQTVEIQYRRDNKLFAAIATLRSAEEVDASKSQQEPKGYLGVVPIEYQVRRSTWSAPIVAAGLIKQFTELTFKGIGTALSSLAKGNTAQASDQVAGPVGIFFVLKDGAFFGLPFILMVIAVLSLSLALMNALPIPALDGGRLFVTLLFRVLKRRLTPRLEDLIHGAGFAALMALFILITVVDVKRFF